MANTFSFDSNDSNTIYATYGLISFYVKKKQKQLSVILLLRSVPENVFENETSGIISVVLTDDSMVCVACLLGEKYLGTGFIFEQEIGLFRLCFFLFGGSMAERGLSFTFLGLKS